MFRLQWRGTFTELSTQKLFFHSSNQCVFSCIDHYNVHWTLNWHLEVWRSVGRLNLGSLSGLNLFRWGQHFPILRLDEAYSSKSITLVGSNWRLPENTPRWPARSLYGPRGGTAGLDGRSKRQFHIWHALSACRGRAASLLILSWMMMDSASLLASTKRASLLHLLLPLSSTHFSPSACQRPNMAECRDGVHCWGLWMVEVGYKRWTGSKEDCSWFSSSTGWVVLSEPQTQT